jgi:hypothetical protein
MRCKTRPPGRALASLLGLEQARELDEQLLAVAMQVVRLLLLGDHGQRELFRELIVPAAAQYPKVLS